MNPNTMLQVRSQLPELAKSFRCDAPKPNDPYWRTNDVFVQLLAIDTKHSDSPSPVVMAHFKITGVNEETLWTHFEKCRPQLESLVTKTIKEKSRGRLEAEQINFYHGSVEIVIVLKFLVDVISAYPDIKIFVGDLHTIITTLMAGFGMSFVGYAAAKRSSSSSPCVTIVALSIVGIIALVGIVGLLSGLRIGSPDRAPAPAYSPPANSEPAVAAPASSAVVLTVVNNAASEVCYLYVKTSASDTWEYDLLGTDKIASGDTVNLNIDSGVYSFQAQDCNASSLGEVHDWDIQEGSTLTIN